jgi:hypothetical protein
MKQGTLKADAVTLASIEVNFMEPASGKMTAKAAFVGLSTGITHGWTTHQIWSPETLLKLKELKESMEIDLGAFHFIGGAQEVGGATRPATAPGGPPAGGLSEHLGGNQIEDAESIT